MQTEKLIHALIRLNEVENTVAGTRSTPEDLTRERQMARLRRAIPEPYLEHYRQRRLRGKRTIVPVVGGICRSCFLQLPSGSLQQLRSEKELLVCPNCSAFIYEETMPVKGARKSKAAGRTAASALGS